MGTLMNYIKSRRTFIRISLITFIFLFAAVSCLGFLYYSYTSKKLVDEYDDNNYKFLSQAKTAIGIIVDTMAYTTYGLYEDTRLLADIRNVLYIGAIERSYILNILSNVKNSSKYIDSVSLYIFDSGIVLSTDYGFSSLADFPDRKWLAENAVTNTDLKLINNRKLVKSAYNDNQSINVLTLMNRIPYTPSMNAMLIVNFDTDRIYDSIVSKLNLASDTEVFAIGRSGNIVFKNKQSGITDALSNQSFIRMIQENKQNGTVVCNGRRYLVSAIFSEYVDSYIVWVSSYKRLNDTISAIGKIIVVNCIVLLLLLVSAAFFLIHRISKPIDELRKYISGKLRSPLDKLNVQGIKKFIGNTFDNYSELQSKMERMLPFFKEKLLYGLMTRNDLDCHEIKKRLEEHEISFDYKYFHVLCIDILNLYQPYEGGINSNIRRLAVHETFGRILSSAGMYAYKVDIDDTRVAIIVNLNEYDIKMDRSRMEMLLQSSCQVLEDKFRIKIAIGVSDISDSICGISDLYKSSVNALNYRLIGNIGNIVFQDQVTGKQKAFDEFGDMFENRLENIILVGDAGRAVNVVKDIFGGYEKEGRTTALRFQNGAMYFMMILIRIASKINCDLLSASNENGNIFQTVSGLKTVEEAEAYFTCIVNEICGQRFKVTGNEQEFFYSRIIEYIDKNYTSDISIDTASQAIGISRSYIFRILSENGRSSFTEYITGKRMEKACELLQKHSKVQDIARNTGFSSTTYFIHVFKKHMGCTPNEYRKVCL